MPQKRNQKNSESPTVGAMADCVLPQDLMLCILTRLPVKSIHRFKCVCKPLRQVLSSPKFAKMHRAQFPQHPENQSAVICCRTAEYELAISLLKIESDEEKRPTMLDIPFPQVSDRPGVVGSCNGLLLMYFPKCKLIALWNPALNNMFKFLPPSNLGTGDTQIVSVGFGYNEEADDFKVIIIVDSKKNNKISLKVYSANSNSWSTIDVDCHFTMLYFRVPVAIVNGNPYWVALVDQKRVLVCFDVRKMEFKIVHLPDLFNNYEEINDILFVDWKGDLGALVRKKNRKRVDVWVFDDVGWTKNRSFGLPLKVRNLLHCLKNGKILVGEYFESGKLFVLDTENGGVKEILFKDVRAFQIYDFSESLVCIKVMENDGGVRERRFEDEVRAFEVYGYSESLAYIKGMEKLYETL